MNQINFFFLARKVFCILLLGTFLFVQAKKLNDSVDKCTNKTRVFVVGLAFISGIEKIEGAEFEIAEKPVIKNVAEAVNKKLFQETKRVRKKNINKKDVYKKATKNSLYVVNHEPEKKYFSWLFEELKTITESLHKSNFATIVNQIILELFFEQALSIVVFEEDKIASSRNSISYIRPPPNI